MHYVSLCNFLFLVVLLRVFEVVMQCLPVDDFEWREKIDAFNQKLPEAIDLLSRTECQELEIDGVSNDFINYSVVFTYMQVFR